MMLLRTRFSAQNPVRRGQREILRLGLELGLGLGLWFVSGVESCRRPQSPRGVRGGNYCSGEDRASRSGLLAIGSSRLGFCVDSGVEAVQVEECGP